MSTARAKSAFTLLEVMTATFIIALVGFSIFRIVEVNLTAIRVSMTRATGEMSLQGIVAMLARQLADLSPLTPGALSGEAHKFNGLASDEIQWITSAGNGLLTRNASGDYKVTLALQPVEKTDRTELGLRRALPDADVKDYNWLPLLDGVVAMEIRYYDPRMNSWLEKWSDPQARPGLVRVRIWRDKDQPPYEAVIPMPVITLNNPA
jgi:hypothetical protein